MVSTLVQFFGIRDETMPWINTRLYLTPLPERPEQRRIWPVLSHFRPKFRRVREIVTKGILVIVLENFRNDYQEFGVLLATCP